MVIQETPTTLARTQAKQVESLQRVRGGLRFDWAFTLACCWLIGGLHLDGWAHNHIPELETFFTSWHAALYSGYGAIAAVLAVTLVRNRARGHAWRQALPPGYAVSFVGVVLFAVGGVLDMVWHLLFGIERSVEALLSPTHLLLATSGVLMVTGPLRAAWRRLPARSDLTWGTGLPALLSLTFVAAVLAFFTQFAHPFVDNLASAKVDVSVVPPFFDQALGVGSILLQTAILMGVVLLLVRRWAPPFGALALIFTLVIIRR
jgi:hypothetical protein